MKGMDLSESHEYADAISFDGRSGGVVRAVECLRLLRLLKNCAKDRRKSVSLSDIEPGVGSLEFHHDDILIPVASHFFRSATSHRAPKRDGQGHIEKGSTMIQPATQPFDFETAYQCYLDGLLTNNREQCRLTFEQWLASNAELRTLYEDLVRRSLYEVGDLWERGKISVATEHIATAINESLLNLTYPRLFAQPRNGKSAMVTCMSNEYHQIGAKMVADIFELHGWRGYFLGANTPVKAVMALITEKRPDVIALSAAVIFSLDSLIRSATEIRSTFPDVPILVGGQAFRWGGRERIEHLPGVSCMMTLSELELWMKDSEKHV